MDPPEAIFHTSCSGKKRIFLSESGKKKKIVSGIMEVVKTKSCVHFEEAFFSCFN